MKAGLLVFPFLSLMVAAMATVLGSTMQEMPWVSYAAWAFAAGLLAAWVALDLEGFKEIATRRGSKYGASSSVSVVLVILIILGAGWLTKRPRFDKSYDATRSGVNTLSDQSVKILEKIKKDNAEIKITAFFQNQQVEDSFRDLAERYRRVSPVIEMEVLDPMTNPTRVKAEKLTNGNTVIVRHGEQEARLTTFNEEKFTNALVKVMKDKTKKIYFTKGHGEGDLASSTEANGFGIVFEELKNNRYEVEQVSLLEEGKVPDDASMVVVAGTTYELREEEARMLEDYAKKGGALLVAVGAARPVKTINGLLAKFGIRVENDLLILRPDDPRAVFIGQNNALVSNFDSLHAITKGYSTQSNVMMAMGNARSVSMLESNENEMKVELIAKTSPVIIRVKDVVSESDLQNLGQDRIEEGEYAVLAVASGTAKNGPELAENDSESNEKQDVAAESDKSTPEQEIRVVAVGSAEFASNVGAQRAENIDMFLNISNYLLQDEDFISIRPKDLEKSTLTMHTAGSHLLLFFLAFVYPFMFLGAGVVFWLKRRNA